MVLANDPSETPAPSARTLRRRLAKAAPAAASEAGTTKRKRSRKTPAPTPVHPDAAAVLDSSPVAGTVLLPHADALRRIAADVSGELDLDRLFEHVIDEAFTLFGVDRAALWTYDGSLLPLQLATQRDVPAEVLAVVADLPRDAGSIGFTAIRERRVVVDRDLSQVVPELQRLYRAHGIQTVCLVPIVVREEPLGLLVLYHRTNYPWSTEATDLARAFGDHIAIALRNARLAASTRSLAERLRLISELAARLARQRDTGAIARTIVAEARRVIEHDSIRVYRVDHETGMCEPLAFQGSFLGLQRPRKSRLRLPIGVGLTGWVAVHGEILRVGDAAADPRSVIVGRTDEPESMLVVPMTYQAVVHGVIVVSRVGRDRFSEDDETTLSIFAGYAAQAMVNAANRAQLERQTIELEHRLSTQQRFLQVNERLLSTLDPADVLDLIADSVKDLVPYDSLIIYEVDRAADVRHAIVARGPFAKDILAQEAPLTAGINGWVAEHGEAILSNDSHLDPRSEQNPILPSGPRSRVVVPLTLDGRTMGTLDIGRSGGDEAHFSENEFELAKLIAGQASIALRNARAHGEVRVRAEHDALTGLRNHGAFQRELGDITERSGDDGRFSMLIMDLDAFKGYNDSRGHPAGDALLSNVARAMADAIRDGDRLYRYGGDEFAAILPGADRVAAHDVAERLRRAVSTTTLAEGGPDITVSIGVACYPEDGRGKDALVTVADRAMYLAKPAVRIVGASTSGDDPYLRALDETALALLDRRDSAVLLETILGRACALLGTPHGFVYIADPDGSELVLRHGIGLFAQGIGHRQTVNEGIGGQVYLSGRAVAIDDYDSYLQRAGFVPNHLLGAVIGVPLSSGEEVVGVIGLASGSGERSFRDREVDALTRFAQLASIALDNARLVDVAQRGALYDLVTGLPNRDLLTDRIAHSLARVRVDDAEPIAVIFLDLDRFKVINESVGHAVADRLLAAVGQRLAACLRAGDTVARFGADEFAVILDSVADESEAREIAERLATELRTPFPLAGREWFISASIGITLGVAGRATPEELLREAEIAMIRAKSDPSRRFVVFEPSMSSQTLERIDLENDLRRGLERGELRAHYQPIVDLASERVVGFEALVRWQHPERGLMPPLEFIPLAEESGLIVPLGRWVLETACRQAATWRDKYPDRDPVFMSVNLSARQFVQADLVEDVALILAETGLDPKLLELEITESVVMDQSEVGVRTLGRLREMGVRLVLDDFGTGYSSLSYLKHLPLDLIKIDRSFVAGLDGPADRSIVEAVLALAHGLRIGVVAEGIETKAQHRQLMRLGCELGQGYLFSRPVPAEEAVKLIAPDGGARRTADPGVGPVGPRPAVKRPAKGRPTISSGRRRGGA